MTRVPALLLAVAALLAPAAATTLTASLSHDATASVSEPLLVTAQVAASSLSSSQVSVGVTLSDNTGGAFSISSATQTLTFTTNSTQTVTWSVTPVQAGTFSTPFTVNAKTNSGSSSDVPGTATSAGAVTVTARPLLDIACTPATTSPSPDVPFPVNCTLSNPSGRNVTDVRTCLFTSGNTLRVEITSSLPTQVQNFTFSGIDTISNPNPSCYDVGTVGSVFATSWSVTGNKNPPPPTPPPVTPTGGGPPTVEEEVVILDPLVGLLTLVINAVQEHVLDSVAQGVQQVLQFTRTLVAEITFTLRDSASSVSLAVQQLAGLPKEVKDAPEGQPYRYFTVRTENIGREENILEASVSFKVEKSALDGASPDGVLLQKYLKEDGKLVWKPLPTTKTGEDGQFVYFKGITPGFSIFAIAGDPARDARVSLFAVTLPPEPGLAPSVSGPELSLPSAGAPPADVVTGGISSAPLLLIAAAAVAGAAVTALVLARRRKG